MPTVSLQYGPDDRIDALDRQLVAVLSERARIVTDIGRAKRASGYPIYAPHRERQVLDGVVAGQPNKTIAFELGISPRTVEVYRAGLMGKMQAKSLPELVRMVMSLGMDAHG